VAAAGQNSTGKRRWKSKLADVAIFAAMKTAYPKK
jgi:hypothetical protein